MLSLCYDINISQTCRLGTLKWIYGKWEYEYALIFTRGQCRHLILWIKIMVARGKFMENLKILQPLLQMIYYLVAYFWPHLSRTCQNLKFWIKFSNFHRFFYKTLQLPVHPLSSSAFRFREPRPYINVLLYRTIFHGICSRTIIYASRKYFERDTRYFFPEEARSVSEMFK